MLLHINGEQRNVQEVSTVADLLRSFQLQDRILVVELNRLILEKDQYNEAKLTENDTLEIVHFVGGG